MKEKIGEQLKIFLEEKICWFANPDSKRFNKKDSNENENFIVDMIYNEYLSSIIIQHV